MLAGEDRGPLQARAELLRAVRVAAERDGTPALVDPQLEQVAPQLVPRVELECAVPLCEGTQYRMCDSTSNCAPSIIRNSSAKYSLITRSAGHMRNSPGGSRSSPPTRSVCNDPFTRSKLPAVGAVARCGCPNSIPVRIRSRGKRSRAAATAAR